MKLNLPAALITAMLLESPSFASYVAHGISEESLKITAECSLRNEVLLGVLRATGKIAAIKFVREQFDKSPETFQNAFPDLYKWDCDNQMKPFFGLKASKDFVEAIRNFD